MIPLRLVGKNLRKHWVRTVLTIASMSIAVFLLCVLRSIVVALDAGVRGAARDRLIVQSSVSLFVYLPESYETKLREVPGVENVCRWNWFGGYYQDQSNFFAQFSTDPVALHDMYPEIELVDGSWDTFLSERQACIVGQDTANRFGFQVGDSLPIIGALFPRLDGSAWDLKIAGIYRATKASVDSQTVFFHYKFVDEAIESGEASGPRGVGIFVVKTASGANQTAIMSAVDAMFEGGPQRVQTTTEAEFQAQFVSMFGNVPFFVATIGGGVLAAILLAVLNTMLMAAREQTRDAGILKALGFTDGSVFGVMLVQSLLLCSLGGLGGLILAVASEPVFIRFMGTMFPGYHVTGETIALGVALSVGLGILAGLAPAILHRRMSPVAALRTTA